jgi:hypothetical protein
MPRITAKCIGSKLRRVFPKDHPGQLVHALTNEQGVASNTARNWLNDIGATVTSGNDVKLFAFMDKRGVEVGYEWLACELEDEHKHRKGGAPAGAASTQAAELDKSKIPTHLALPAANAKRPVFLSIELPPSSTLTPTQSDLFVGKYLLYRYSYTGRPEIVVEVATIAPLPGNNLELKVKMFCHPAHNDHALEHPRRVPPTFKDVEIYEGRLFRLENMYSIVCLFTDVSGSPGRENSHRARYVVFPEVEVPRREHFGIMLGYSPNLEEPVACRILARKMRGGLELDESDCALVERLQRTGDPSGRTISEHILKLITLDDESRKSDILSVDQKMVSKKPREPN